jgi:hypothetical protein
MQTDARLAGSPLAIVGALLGLLLLGAGGASLTGALLELLDGDVLWPSLVAGTIGCVAGSVVFLRASRQTASAGTIRATRAASVARILGAGGAIALGIGTSTFVAVSTGGVLSDRVFEEACSGLAGITCLIQAEVGGVIAGLLLGIRGARSVLRGRWTILLVLVAVAALEWVVVMAQRLSS